MRDVVQLDYIVLRDVAHSMGCLSDNLTMVKTRAWVCGVVMNTLHKRQFAFRSVLIEIDRVDEE